MQFNSSSRGSERFASRPRSRPRPFSLTLAIHLLFCAASVFQSLTVLSSSRTQVRYDPGTQDKESHLPRRYPHFKPDRPFLPVYCPPESSPPSAARLSGPWTLHKRLSASRAVSNSN
ncbi:hypothetical protein K402DRAFT_180980 [Aulographum hederae CBS 113979]|uniref:Uncharacterized protein n=1 Tax=Aulographum hederae CBS 113979 TaxID=1176131 RepID=A0A6G1GQ17_9PEZI|nr:hypothetical protein K402DRAFT_180980 [Aulographum hederae CBS 113979]